MTKIDHLYHSRNKPSNITNLQIHTKNNTHKVYETERNASVLEP